MDMKQKLFRFAKYMILIFYVYFTEKKSDLFLCTAIYYIDNSPNI